MISILTGPISLYFPFLIFGDIPKWRYYWLSRWISEDFRDLVLALMLILLGAVFGLFALRATDKSDSRGRASAIASLVISAAWITIRVMVYIHIL